MKKIVSAALALVMMLSLIVVSAPAVLADTPAAPSGKVFAGYYTDSTYSTAALEETAYPKYVDSNVLTAKYQLIFGVNEDDATTRMRVVTTVDSLHYQEVGFFLQINGDTERKLSTKTVAKKIIGTTDGLDELEYKPTEFSSESMYFCAFNFTVSSSAYSKTMSFTPYWVTMSGETVRGEQRDIVINQSPYFNNILIKNAAELNAFATASQSKSYAGWTIKLTADIDLNPGFTATESGMDNGSGGTPAQWTTIGKIYGGAVPFAGTFDGQGHTISGLYVYNVKYGQGLFGYTSNTAVIQNLRLTNSRFETNQSYLGSIVGKGSGTIRNVYSDAIVTSTKAGVGGIVGQLDAGDTLTVEGCWFDGLVKSQGSGTSGVKYGGIAGGVSGSGTTLSVSDCLFTGTVNNNTGSYGNNYVGGIVGGVETGAEATLATSLCAGTIQVASGKQYGLLVGMNDSATLDIDTCYGVGAYANGCCIIAGRNTTVAVYIRCADTSWNREAFADSNVWPPKMPSMFLSSAPTGSAAASSLTNFDFPNKWITVPGAVAVPSSFDRYGSDTIVLSTAEDLREFAARSLEYNFAGKTVKVLVEEVINAGEGDADEGGTGIDGDTETEKIKDYLSIFRGKE